MNSAIRRIIIIFHDRNQRSANSKTGTVQGVDELRLFIALGFKAGIHPPCLKITAGGTTGYLAVCILPRQPCFNIVSFACPKACISTT